MVHKRALQALLKSIHLPRHRVSVAHVVTSNFLLPIVVIIFVAASLSVALAFPTRLLAADTLRMGRFAPLVQSSPACVELIANGDFESSTAGWSSVAGSSLYTYATDEHVGGQRSLLLGFTSALNITTTFGVEQVVALPADSTTIDFSFHYNTLVGSDNGSGGDPGDQAFLTISDADNNQLLAMLMLTPTNARWNSGRYNLTPLAGKKILLTFIVKNDGEPGRLAMRMDDISILACRPAEAFALQPLPTYTPTIESSNAEPQPTEPVVAPDALPNTVPNTGPAIPVETPAPQIQESFPQVGVISSLEACDCSRSLYTCSNFSSWAVAQACYTQCQVAAGYDIHNLDPDRNGIACELELLDVAPLDATPSSEVPEQSSSNPDDASSTTTGVVGVVTTVVAAPAQPAVGSGVTATLTGTVSSNSLTESAVVTNMAETGSISVSETATSSTPISSTIPTTGAVAAAPLAPAGQGDVSSDSSTLAPDSGIGSGITPVSFNQPTSGLGALSALFFSPVGYLLVGMLLVIMALGVWVAYMIGQRGRAIQATPLPGNSPPEDFTLKSSNEANSSKS